MAARELLHIESGAAPWECVHEPAATLTDQKEPASRYNSIPMPYSSSL